MGLLWGGLVWMDGWMDARVRFVWLITRLGRAHVPLEARGGVERRRELGEAEVPTAVARIDGVR